MANEQEVKQELITKFSVPRIRSSSRGRGVSSRTFPSRSSARYWDYVINNLKFDSLGTITGTDDGPNFGAIYTCPQDGTVLSLRIHTPRENPVIDGNDLYPPRQMYERDL